MRYGSVKCHSHCCQTPEELETAYSLYTSVELNWMHKLIIPPHLTPLHLASVFASIIIIVRVSSYICDVGEPIFFSSHPRFNSSDLITSHLISPQDER